MTVSVKKFIIFHLFVLSLSSYGSIARVYGVKPLDNSSQKNEKPRVRVRVKKNLRDVFISGTDLKRKLYKTNSIKSFSGRKSIRFNCKGLSQKKKKSERPLLLASLRSKTGLISLGKKKNEEKHRGLLHIISTARSDSCDVIHESDIEDYLASLLTKEMNAKWPSEALKAQAVVARTYAIHKINSKQVSRKAGFETFYHLENSEKHQVSGNYFDATVSTMSAARGTEGEVLIDPSDKITPAFFHAKCGGKTLRPVEVWQNRVRGYKGIKCSWCRDHGRPDYDKSLGVKRFKEFLKWAREKKYLTFNPVPYINEKIRIIPDHKFNRKLRIYLGDKVFSFKKSLLRRYFGRVIVPSNNFVVSIKKYRVLLKGSGLGHGVGMCQLGALDLADQGWDYKKILNYYYPEHRLKKVY